LVTALSLVSSFSIFFFSLLWQSTTMEGEEGATSGNSISHRPIE
jgi:hypothetical protein